MDSTSRMRSSSGRWSSIPKRRLERVVKAAGAASQTASAEAPLARSKSKAAIQRLASIVRNGKDSDAIRACEALLDRGFGRPPPQHALQGQTGPAPASNSSSSITSLRLADSVNTAKRVSADETSRDDLDVIDDGARN